ncbi:hypothetical protein C8J56DRAFT_890256 [Mycena floridula]|nr:hypothetical protein C8J56DRAFT_890256 [Mycena floridula]
MRAVLLYSSIFADAPDRPASGVRHLAFGVNRPPNISDTGGGRSMICLVVDVGVAAIQRLKEAKSRDRGIFVLIQVMSIDCQYQAYNRWGKLAKWGRGRASNLSETAPINRDSEFYAARQLFDEIEDCTTLCSRDIDITDFWMFGKSSVKNGMHGGTAAATVGTPPQFNHTAMKPSACLASGDCESWVLGAKLDGTLSFTTTFIIRSSTPRAV